MQVGVVSGSWNAVISIAHKPSYSVAIYLAPLSPSLGDWVSCTICPFVTAKLNTRVAGFAVLGLAGYLKECCIIRR